MTEPVGIIYPPPELRGIVDSTAKYVAKNGGAFEERIKREHKDKPKFSFLFQDDPFNAYYQHKVKEIRATLLDDLESKAVTNETATKPTSDDTSHGEDLKDQGNRHETADPSSKGSQDSRSDHANSQPQTNLDQFSRNWESDDKQPDEQLNNMPRVRMKLSEYIEEMSTKLEEPTPLNHLATFAPSLTYMDCDIIKLTSRYTATYGRSFLLELVNREHSNMEFDFIKPQHGQFKYMTNLIMQYALIQNQPLDILEQMEKDSSSQKHVLDKIRMRAEWVRMLELEERKREEAIEQEKLLYSQIDWQDFVIVETIDYQPGEKGEFPPTTADQVGTRLLIQQRLEETRNDPEEMDIDMEF